MAYFSFKNKTEITTFTSELWTLASPRSYDVPGAVSVPASPIAVSQYHFPRLRVGIADSGANLKGCLLASEGIF